MQAKQTILDMWQLADANGIAATFVHVYGQDTARERYKETVDAFSREDDVRIVKSMQQLWEDAPDAPIIHKWPMWSTVCSIAEHIFDEDYTSTKTVPHDKRDPNINMYSEAVTKDNAEDEVNLNDPIDFMSAEELLKEDDDGETNIQS